MTSAELNAIAQSPSGLTINFDRIERITFKAKNAVNSQFSGEINKKHLFHINIIQSLLKSVKASGVNFVRCDIKDCSITNSSFDNCNFNEAAHVNNQINDCTFHKCTFALTSITDSEFRDTVFHQCDFSNVIISNSRFTDCKFIKCKTSNKMVESSLLFNCVFDATNIYLETITENFGLHERCLINSSIIRAIQGKKKLVKPSEVDIDAVDDDSPVERFIISYFRKPEILLEGSRDIDATFEFESWLQLSRNPNRFRLLIERYHEFIMYNYERDQVPFWIILKLHSMTDELSRKISENLIDIYRSIMGVHMSLSRLVETYLQLCDGLLRLYGEKREITLLVQGPMEPAYYYKELPQFFEGSSLKVQKVIKHNSPNELFLVWDKIHDFLPIITIFLATRVKFELQKRMEVEEKSVAIVSGRRTALQGKEYRGPHTIDLLSTELGFDDQINTYAFKLRAILPGHLLMNLKLELRSKAFGKIKKIILDIIPRSTLKVGNST